MRLENVFMTTLEAAGSCLQLQRIIRCRLKKHYEKVGEDIEQITRSYQEHHPAWVEGW